MKIAIICSSFFPVIDGVTITVYKRLEQLSILEHQVRVFCPDYSPIKHIYPNYQEYTGEIFPGIQIISLPSSKAIALEFERDVTIKSYQIVIEELNKFQPNIIHVDEAERLGLCFLKLPGVKYAQQQNIPCVAWFHTNYIDYFDDYFNLPWGLNKLIKKILSLIFAKIYNSYDSTLVSSSITAQNITTMGIKNISCAELLGCDLSQFNNIAKTTNFFAKQYNLPDIENKLKLIFLGRLTPDKGWNFAVKTLPKLPPEILNNIAIIIVGDGNLKIAPQHALPGLEGETKRLRLELKLIAEVGIIGLPNAGKSTLISALSSAKPKVANYPFTTLVPNLGVVRKPTGDGTVFADIPGLISGASEGVGLGHDFLRHIERTRILLHLIDATAENPLVDYQTIQQELEAYGHGLPERPQIIALNKIDAVDEDILELITSELQELTPVAIFHVSAVTRKGLDTLMQKVWTILDAELVDVGGNKATISN